MNTKSTRARRPAAILLALWLAVGLAASKQCDDPWPDSSKHGVDELMKSETKGPGL